MFFLSHVVRRRGPYLWICQSCRRRLVSSAASNGRPAASSKLPDIPARTRFAPSPTGYLHLGSLRTALFNYLLAKSTGGQFLLRIEDTDQKRTIPDAEDRLCKDLEWAGLHWDEGPKVGGAHGPYKQSQRTRLYQDHAEKLLLSGHAYRCFCSPERLHALAQHRAGLGLPTNYDRQCVHVSAEESDDRAAKGEAHVVRFKVPPKYPRYTDLVYGLVRNPHDESKKANLHPSFEDPILLKSDGFPTYHLANVVDDHFMKITHVVRGAEWMSSTPKHLSMYEAFQWKAPQFAHVGLLLDENRQKLSKRNMDLDVSSYRDKMGIFPETLVNFVALLGWSHGRGKDVMNLAELVQNFSLKFTTGDTVVTFGKMWYLQRAHAERYSKSDNTDGVLGINLMTEPIINLLRKTDLVDDLHVMLNGFDTKTYVPQLVRADARNYTNAPAFVQRNKYFFETPGRQALRNALPSLRLHHVPKPVPELVQAENLVQAISFLESISTDWTAETIKTCTKTILSSLVTDSLGSPKDNQENLEETKKAVQKSWTKLFHGYIRWAILAGMPGPDGAETMEILGRKETLARLATAADVILHEEPEGMVTKGAASEGRKTESDEAA